jgi:AcrR family transcriptional regulator
MAQEATQGRLPLSRDRILRAALGLADESGIESVTMRKLAQALGVEAMSLYNHVADKADIVEGIVDRVVGMIELPASPVEWETAIRTCAVSAYDAFRRHPWACALVLTPGPSPAAPSARLRYMEWLLARLRGAGFSPEVTYHAYHAVDSHILGFTMWELGHSAPARQDIGDLAAIVVRGLPVDEFPYLLEHVQQHRAGFGHGGVSEFEYGLDLILDGLKRSASLA